MTSNSRHGLPPRLMAHQPTRFATAQESKPSPSPEIRIRTNNPACTQTFARLKGFDGGLCFGTEHAVYRDGLATRPQQVLQSLDGVVLVAVLDHWPGAKASGHNVPLVQPTFCRLVNLLQHGCGWVTSPKR